MREKCYRRYLWMIAAAGLFLAAVFPAEAYAPEKTGSVRIALSDLEVKHSSREGVEFRLWSVGAVDENGTPLIDEAYGIEKYPTTGEELSSAAKKLSGKVSGTPYRTGRTNAQGVVSFTEVERGVYLVQAAEKNGYGVVAPFLLHLPYWDEEESVFVYEAEAEPKASPNEPKKPEKPKEPGKPGRPDKAPRVQTGDTALPERYTGMLLLSTGALLGLSIRKKRPEEKREGEQDR